MPDPQALRLMLVSDSALCGARGLAEVVAAAVRGGVGSVQLREKHRDGRELVALARALKQQLAPLGVPLIVNDRLDVALAAGADGVHLGQRDLSVADARRLWPQGLIGLSIENPEQLRAAEALAIDYYGASPVFATPTKTDTAPALGLHGLAALRALTTRPLLAIGGITAANAAAVRAAGADGLAVVSALCAAADPEAAARALLHSAHFPETA